MNDCPNGDVRDLLPDLLHERLDPAARAMAEAHLRSCADCQAELALLRDLRSALGRSPSLDLEAIDAAVPAYRAPMRRSWVGWRTAAAITFVAAGASSVVVWQRDVAPRSDSAAVEVVRMAAADSPVATVPGVPPVAKTSSAQLPRVAAVAPAPVPRAGRELAMAGGSLNDLSDRELASLLREIETLDAVPTTDVESPTIAPLAPRRGQP